MEKTDMKKIAVIYESKYGYTRKYAEWIGEELSCPVFEKKVFHTRDLSRYETVIYGGGLYAGGISGIKFITKNRDLLSGKKVLIFTCGLADPDNPDNVSNIRKSLEKVFTEEMMEHVHLFHLRGGIDYSRLNLVHRFMMSMLRKMLLKKDADDLTKEDSSILNTYGQCLDFTKRESIRPLVEDAMSEAGMR